MNKYKYSDLLLYKKKIKDLYSNLGLNFDDSNRISKYFKYLGEIEKSRNLDKDKFHVLIQKNKAKYYYSQFYVLEICKIIDALQNTKIDNNILKVKLTHLAKGTYLLSEEDINNTQARDTTFELSLFSFFYARNLRVKLGRSNPDLQLSTTNFTYNIECKRPYSMKSLEKNIRKALKQLRKTQNSVGIPTMALSLEQIILGDDLILDSKDEQSALAFLNALLSQFYQNNLAMIRKICNDEPCLILYCLSCLTGFKTDIPMTHTTFIVGNIYNFDQNLSASIHKDLQIMLPSRD
ncbi:hypothetical protein A3D78_05780 [Candidatus Gottesmanbacteria bacterium RIFCSPHIGHO2_02_FULL_39_14]|uniref:Uncharacterized protein n=1 Tax=Candidatus Gottesmanbacteria bacterium RIFCSPHIGHO2_02_FULL_39_14 TaxID=1798383 RepID=A0A1F6A3S4_9BACT|nr:MAG: hypothetical protein A3D78_05780 [Candidatus Gottesmanbacteria bacterium RIFCSPHIGHO2_02_FULL_39_14]